MANTMVLLEKVTVGAAGAASITFSNIPQTGYTDLKIVASTRNSAAAVQVVNTLKLGSIVTGYSDKYLYGSGSAAGSGSFGATNGFMGDAPAASATASTFGNQEIYIANYTSSNAKSWSVDSVSETNATTAYMELTAVSNTSTAAISSITIAPTSGNFVQYSTFSLYGVSNVNTTPTIAPKATGGDIIQTDGTYWYHAFLNSGTFTPAVGLTADVLVVAGGGGAGISYGAGGGGGGVIYFASQTLSTTGYTCTVGAGGVGNGSSNPGTNGGNSQFGSLTVAVGGGGGGGQNAPSNPVAGANGGSGGGGGANASSGGYAGGSSTQTGTGATAYYGNAGGTSAVTAPGGGGGAGSAGTNGSSGGNGGGGTSVYSSWGAATATGVLVSSSYYYAGGGSGYNPSANPPAAGGTARTVAGQANSGQGAGGDAAVNGGSGIVIVRYTVA